MLKPPEIKEEKNTGLDYKVNLNNIDELLGELSTPVQDFRPREPIAGEEKPGIYDPVGNEYSEVGEHIEISPEKNARNGERTAKIFDGIISMGAQTLAKAETRDSYKASKDDLKDIGDEWANYTKDKPFNIPPWAMLAMLYITTYLPKITKAMNDRRINYLSDRIAKLEDKEKKK
ncbi:MAG: hypothetical protein GXO88_07835 [Chlorobi bacterium]|nr:hypothetical protein [Chlorobiota bacterium]